MVTNVIFVVFGSADEQPWNNYSAKMDMEQANNQEKPRVLQKQHSIDSEK